MVPDEKKLNVSAGSCPGRLYVSPGSNNRNGIDCSGLFMECFRDQGGSIYQGSNTICRFYCTEKGKLTCGDQYLPEMAVFKWNVHTPDKFNDDPGDFQHTGMAVHRSG